MTSTITSLTEVADYYSDTYHYRRYPARVAGRAGAFCVWARDVERPNPNHVTWSPEVAVIVAREYQTAEWHAERAEQRDRPAVEIGELVRLDGVVITVPKRAREYVDSVPCEVVALAHRCDWQGCERDREPSLLFCAEHVGAEIDRWLRDSGYPTR